MLAADRRRIHWLRQDSETVRAGNKRTIDLLSSIDFECRCGEIVWRERSARLRKALPRQNSIGRALFGDAAVDPPGPCQVQRTASEANKLQCHAAAS